MRNTLALAAALAMPFALPAYAEQPPLSVADMNALVDSSNFIVHVGERGVCSGTLISKKYRLILTAHHCIDFAIKTQTKQVTEDGEVKSKDYEVFDDVIVEQPHYSGARNVGTSTYQSTVIGYDKDHDLGLLQIRAATIPNELSVHVWPGADGAAKVERGDTVWAFGNPLGLENSVSFGHIASTQRLFKWSAGIEVTFIQTDAGMLTFGNSGGALMEGRYLVGVPDMTVPGTPVSLSIPYGLVQAMLNEHCYRDVWDDKGEGHDVCEAKKKAKDDTGKQSVKDLLQKLIDKPGAKPTGAGDGYLFNPDGTLYGNARASSEADFAERMRKAAGCTLATFPACMEPHAAAAPAAAIPVKAAPAPTWQELFKGAIWSFING